MNAGNHHLGEPDCILGIDPGLANTGYGLIKKNQGSISLVDFGCIRTSKGMAFSRRLSVIYNEVSIIIDRYHPKCVSIEGLFFYKNAKSALLVGQAKGVVLLSAVHQNVPIFEYTPLEVKKAIVGYGSGTKDQIQKMVRLILKLEKKPEPGHAADALAVAICASNDSLRKTKEVL